MRRREVIAGFGLAAFMPLPAMAEPLDRVRRVGLLMSYTENDQEGRERLAAFHEALRDAGWVDGGNTRLDARWYAGQPEQAVEFRAEELVECARPYRRQRLAGCRGAEAADQHHPNRLCRSRRPGGRWLCRKPFAPGQQHHGFQHFRARDRRQMARGAQGGRAAHSAGRRCHGPATFLASPPFGAKSSLSRLHLAWRR